MKSRQQKARRVEFVFAGMHSTYWMSACTFSGFIAVYLSFYGFSDTLVGVTASLVAFLTIVLQLGISSFSDARPQVPLKRIILSVYLLILGLVAILALVPLPLVTMLITYSLAGGLTSSMPGLYNAQVVQFINTGLPVNFGWPRGVSALLYALMALLLGILLESYQPSILMPICILLLVFAIVMVLVMPEPEQLAEDTAIPGLAMGHTHTTMRQLLSQSKPLRLFLLASVFIYLGQTNIMLFLPRVIAHNGGSQADLGIAMFIQAGVELPAMIACPFLLRRFPARVVLSVSLWAYLLKSILLLFSTGMGTIYVAMGLSILCFGLYGVASVYFVNDLVRPNEKVRAQTLVTASSAVANMVGSLGAGWVVDAYGITRLNLISSLLMLVAAVLMLACARTQAKEEKHLLMPG